MISKRHRYDQGRYAILPREVINNSALTFEARGLLLYLLEKPVDWKVSNEHLYQQSPAGERHVNTILRELKAAGYVHREKVYDPPTRTFRWDTVVYDFPEDNPHFDPARIPTDRMDTKRSHTKRKDTKRRDDLILDPPILEEPIKEFPPPPSRARELPPKEESVPKGLVPEPEPAAAPEPADGFRVTVGPRPTARPVVVVYGAADRTPGGMGYALPDDAAPPGAAPPSHPAVRMLWEETGCRPGEKAAAEIVARMGETPDRAALARAVSLWELSGFRKNNFGGILDWYDACRRDPNWRPGPGAANGRAGSKTVPEIKVVNGLF